MRKYKDRYITKSANSSDVQKQWFLVNAEGALLGRMASKIAKIIRGKHKSNYTPHIDNAFNSVEHIMRNVNAGWAIRYIHANGASLFFIAVYMHINACATRTGT